MYTHKQSLPMQAFPVIIIRTYVKLERNSLLKVGAGARGAYSVRVTMSYIIGFAAFTTK